MTGESRCKALKLDCEISTGIFFVSPVAFTLSKKSPLPLETSSSQEKYRSFTQRKLALKKAELAKTMEEIKIITVRATNPVLGCRQQIHTVTSAAFMEEILAA